MGTWRETVWGQFGAAIDMLERAIRACPDAAQLHMLLRQNVDDAPTWVGKAADPL